MNSKKLNFDPWIDRGDGKNMLKAIQKGKKRQTIRDYPVPAGTILHLWANRRGVKKGFYCEKCKRIHTLHTLHGEVNDKGKFEGCEGNFTGLPYKLLPPQFALEPIPIKVTFTGREISVISDSLDSTGRNLGVYFINDFWKELHPFALRDGFTSNKAMIDFFSKKMKPDVWYKKWINRW